MGDALDLQVVLRGHHVVEQQHRALPAGEELLERQELPPVAQRAGGQEAQLRQRIEHHPRRLDQVDIGQDLERGLAELDLRGMEHRVLLVRLQRVVRRQHLAHLDAMQIPAVGARDALELGRRFGQRDVQHRLAPRGALAQELHRHRGLSRAGRALQQIQPVGREAAAQHVVEAGHAHLQQRFVLLGFIQQGD
jgi:hypothetical protein